MFSEFLFIKIWQYIPIKLITILLAIAYYTVAERKILAAIQRRSGPNVVGVVGILQPIADGLKLLLKTLIVPIKAYKLLFIIAPCIFLILTFLIWTVIPLTFDYSEFSTYASVLYSILFVLAISSINVYPVLFGGWASNSKYAFLGGIRSAAQMISYEVSLGLLILPIVLWTGSFNFATILLWQDKFGWFCFSLLPNFILFFISILAETNRTPFDLPEAEGELVAGYNVEYSGIIFAMYFLSEYGNMIAMSIICSLLFLGGGFFKTIVICYLFVLVRATYPRYRYDQLMNIGWKLILPLSLGLVTFNAGIILTINTWTQWQQ